VSASACLVSSSFLVHLCMSVFAAQTHKCLYILFVSPDFALSDRLRSHRHTHTHTHTQAPACDIQTPALSHARHLHYPTPDTCTIPRVQGPKDIITDGYHTVVCDTQGSPRRCGGQGDVLGGLLLAFKTWTHAAVKKESGACVS